MGKRNPIVHALSVRYAEAAIKEHGNAKAALYAQFGPVKAEELAGEDDPDYLETLDRVMYRLAEINIQRLGVG